MSGSIKLAGTKFRLSGEFDVSNEGVISVADNAISSALFTADGAGAVARTVESKLRDVVSVRDFGAVGDGVADDTAAIQAAIDVGRLTGATVFMPPGTYAVTSLALGGTSRRFKFCGAGRDSTILLRYSDSPGTVVRVTTSTSGCVIEDFTINAQHSLFPNGNHGLAVQDSSDVAISRVTVRDYKNTGILVYSSGVTQYKNCIVRECEVDGGDAANLGMNIADMLQSGFIDCRALNIAKAGDPGYGQQLKNGCQDCFIVNGYSESASMGFVLSNNDVGRVNQNNRVIGCKAYDCDVGLAFGTSRHNIVVGLQVDMNGAGQSAIDLAENSVGNVVRGAIVRNLASAKLVAYLRSGDTDNVVDVDVVDNASGVAGARVSFLSGALRNTVKIGRFANPTNVQDPHTLVSDASAGSTNVFEYGALPSRQKATIASGAITLRHPRMARVIVDTEGAASADDLDTISGGTDGQIITISQEANSRDVTVKHATGNIRLNGAADFAWTSVHQTLTLTYVAGITAWVEVARGTAT